LKYPERVRQDSGSGAAGAAPLRLAALILVKHACTGVAG